MRPTWPLRAAWAVPLATAATAHLAGLRLGPGISPRFFDNTSYAALEARDISQCTLANSHPCLDVGASVCCLDTQYCIVDDSTFQAKCCAIGSLCANRCDASSYACAATITITPPPPAPPNPTTSVTASCCPRKCSRTSQYLCEASLGGGCCSYGYRCVSGGQCVSAAAPTTTTAPPRGRPSGGTPGTICPSSQYACAEGGGCCPNGQQCTVVAGVQACEDPATAGGGGELDTATKAGIGAGVAVGASLIIGLAAWFIIRKRRKRKLLREQEAYRRSHGDPNGAYPGGVYAVGGSSGRSRRRSDQPYPTSPGTTNQQGGRTPSYDAGRPSYDGRRAGAGGGRRGRRGTGTGGPTPSSGSEHNGLTTEYFGPAAAVGEFTTTTNAADMLSPSSAAVPAKPYEPAHFTAPVEIDGRPRQPGATAAAAAAAATGRGPDTWEMRDARNFASGAAAAAPYGPAGVPLVGVGVGGGGSSPGNQRRRGSSVGSTGHGPHGSVGSTGHGPHGSVGSMGHPGHGGSGSSLGYGAAGGGGAGGQYLPQGYGYENPAAVGGRIPLSGAAARLELERARERERDRERARERERERLNFSHPSPAHISPAPTPGSGSEGPAVTPP